VNEPISLKSHIYGGEWYLEGCKKWGTPDEKQCMLSQQFQDEARGNFHVSKAVVQSEVEMPKKAAKAVEIPTVVEAPVEAPVKTRKKKPEAAIIEPKPKPKPKSKPKPKEEPAETVMTREVVIPTHMENTIEQLDTDGYEIEYVKLTIFEHETGTYYRNAAKNKLYKKIQRGVGPYVGRYDADTEEIMDDIPDSDAE